MAKAAPIFTAAGPADDRLDIQLLGEFRVTLGQQSIPQEAWRLRKAASLVKLLALAPNHRLHREQVCDVLWPDLDASAATNNLHYTLHVARRTLERAPSGRQWLRRSSNVSGGG